MPKKRKDEASIEKAMRAIRQIFRDSDVELPENLERSFLEIITKMELEMRRGLSVAITRANLREGTKAANRVMEEFAQ